MITNELQEKLKPIAGELLKHILNQPIKDKLPAYLNQKSITMQLGIISGPNGEISLIQNVGIIDIIDHN